MKITILTLFPQMFDGPFSHSILKRAQEKKAVEINIVNIRNFGIGPHKSVDDTVYGGGAGMILRVDVLKAAIDAVKDTSLKPDMQKVILLDARGATYTQAKAKSLANLSHLILLCGHYEGVDERILSYVDEQISIGNFVLTGGEIPAMAITDSVVRLLKNVIREGATETESFTVSETYLEHPHYTKPLEFEGDKVPEVLTSGNHQEIQKWREKTSQKHLK